MPPLDDILQVIGRRLWKSAVMLLLCLLYGRFMFVAHAIVMRIIALAVNSYSCQGPPPPA